ncbi:MAG: hypothetical protein DI498_08645 [Paracoccus denitrificans]|nr:MAG: hypothetical protein DI498_08645 [Paracoccus denitrificans]PZO84134.1 MAG: hypothetical protein DI633_08645 [Paracoccus denitrificans]
MTGTEFTAAIKDLTLEGRIDEAISTLSEYKKRPDIQPHRISQAGRLIDDVSKIDKLNFENAERLLLRDFKSENRVRLHNIDDVLKNPVGSYVFGKDVFRPSTFDQDFACLEAAVQNRLRASEFDIEITSSNEVNVEIIDGAVICAEDNGLLTCSSYDGRYVRSASSRLAKATRINFRRKPTQFMDQAIVLPAPHTVWNYYHTMTESAYYLRFAEMNNHKVIVPHDCFKIIEYVADRLGIGKDRLISYEKARDLYIRRAALPIPRGFYWSREIYQFFRKLPEKYGEVRKIYISRSLSGRGPKNENDVENAVMNLGFQVVHAQNISVSDQAEMFSGSDFIIAPHGAGLSNLLYTKAGTKLIELFTSNFISRDFYLRSVNNDIHYHPIVFEEELDLRTLKAAIEKLGC